MSGNGLGADHWGISDGYHGIDGTWIPTPDTGRAALARAFGAEAHPDGPPEPPAMWFVTSGDAARLWNPCDLELEDGTVLPAIGALPMDLPIGYHWLHPLDGWPAVRMVVTPGRAPLPPKQMWGWQCQLYATRSARSLGIGDLADLRELNRWSARLGARAVLVNPLHAPPPDLMAAPSPYFASSRLMANPLMLAVDEIEGAHELAEQLGAALAAAAVLNTSRHIDRGAVWELKRPLLDRLYQWQEGRPALREAFDQWTARQRVPVLRWATFCALSERYGRPWRDWPGEFAHPDRREVAEFAHLAGHRVRFHLWLQWQLDRQRAMAAGRGVDVIGDLAVGFEPDGFDAWLWQDLLADGCRVGAPPDGFNPTGQDWGLPPFIPWRLRQERHQPFIDTLRANLAHVGGLRLDHVMGLFRLFCIPPGHRASEGAYVQYPSGDLLDLLTLEATRAEAYVIGEDLGTVADGVRDELDERHVLGCKVMWFERDPASSWPSTTLASATTHDLPTIAGVWSGTDVVERRRLGVADEAAAVDMRRHLLEHCDPAAPIATTGSVADVVRSVYADLAASPAQIVLASLEDALEVTEPPNVPGTIDEWPNWRIALPVPLEELMVDPRVNRLAEDIDRARRLSSPGSAPQVRR